MNFKLYTAVTLMLFVTVAKADWETCKAACKTKGGTWKVQQDCKTKCFADVMNGYVYGR